MSRYAAMFERLAQSREGAFGAFLMLGDPDLETSARLLDALVEGGADMIEVGIPFSDPVADGPVIQAAAQRALAAGVRVDDCFDLIRGFRERHPDVPLGILTYANLVVARTGFARDAAEAGADSLLIADVPALEAEPFARDMEQAGIEPVLIAAANTPDATLDRIARVSKAYTYCVSRAGHHRHPRGGTVRRRIDRSAQGSGRSTADFRLRNFAARACSCGARRGRGRGNLRLRDRRSRVPRREHRRTGSNSQRLDSERVGDAMIESV